MMPNTIKFNYLKDYICENILNWLCEKAEGFFSFGCLPAAARVQTPAAVTTSPAPTGTAMVSCKNGNLKQLLRKIYCVSEGTETKGKLLQMLQKAPKYCNTSVLPVLYLQAIRQHRSLHNLLPIHRDVTVPGSVPWDNCRAPATTWLQFPGATGGPVPCFSSLLTAALLPSRPTGSLCSCCWKQFVPEIKGRHQL